MKIIFSNQPAFIGGEPSLFLAGPTPRSPEVQSWRSKAIELLENLAFSGVVLVPEWSSYLPGVDYISQVDWERAGLLLATQIVFWVPRNMTTFPALTTNVEFGYWLAKSPEKVLYGRPEDAVSTRYLDWLFQIEKASFCSSVFPGIYHPANNLQDLLKTAVTMSGV